MFPLQYKTTDSSGLCRQVALLLGPGGSQPLVTGHDPPGGLGRQVLLGAQRGCLAMLPRVLCVYWGFQAGGARSSEAAWDPCAAVCRLWVSTGSCAHTNAMQCLIEGHQHAARHISNRNFAAWATQIAKSPAEKGKAQEDG